MLNCVARPENAASGSREGRKFKSSRPDHFIMYFVYILQSLSTSKYYIGSTNNILRRFHQHQSGYSKFTRKRGPWFMPYYEIYKSRSEAVKRELELKSKKTSASILQIISNA